MIDTTATTIESPPERQAAQSKNGWPPLWRRLGLAGVILVSIFMNFYQLGQNGFGNLYYASAIRRLPNEVSDGHGKNISAIFRETL